MARVKMLLVEDDAAIAELVIWHFKREDFEVKHTPDGEEALLLAKEATPDIVLLDWMVEGLSGIEVCRRLRRMPETANVPIIMLTARGEEEDRVRGLETGADDYVTKPFSPRELVARVGAVLRRVRPALAGEALTYADIEMDTVGHKVRRGGEVVSLGPTEFRLLKHFLEHPGWVFSRERLLDAVWGHDSDIESRTVDVHIRRLRKAINAPSARRCADTGNPDIIRTVRSAALAMRWTDCSAGRYAGAAGWAGAREPVAEARRGFANEMDDHGRRADHQRHRGGTGRARQPADPCANHDA
jgi:two-component system phosphate regulon response regulator PhoB